MQARRRWTLGLAALAGVFGGMTLFSGGSILFDMGQAKEMAGDYVPFVLWFNFLAGFAYLAAALAMALDKAWAWILALAIAGATVVVFAGFGLHVLSGAPFEMRTVGAMILRSGFWLLAAGLLYRWRRDRSGSAEAGQPA